MSRFPKVGLWLIAASLLVSRATQAAESASLPTATLLGNGQAGQVTVPVGSAVTVTWQATQAIQAHSSYTVSPAESCPGQAGTGPWPWVATTPQGSHTVTALPCHAGHTYTITYTAMNPAGQRATATLAAVVPPAQPTPVSNAQVLGQHAPPSLTVGDSSPVSVIVRNTGTTAWTQAAHYRLGSQAPQDNLTWGLGRVELPVATVAPGETVTFNFPIAPANPGQHAFQWRMVQELVEWFGEASPAMMISVTESVRPPTPPPAQPPPPTTPPSPTPTPSPLPPPTPPPTPSPPPPPTPSPSPTPPPSPPPTPPSPTPPPPPTPSPSPTPPPTTPPSPTPPPPPAPSVPTAVTVSDDGATTDSTTTLHATWTASSDPGSGIAEYQYLIRQDSTDGLILVHWTSTGMATEVSRTDLSLISGKTYYVGVRAKNRDGLYGAIAYSDGITVLARDTPPTGTLSINTGAPATNTTAVTLTLAATDGSSVVDQMRCSNDNVTYTLPEPYATTRAWTLLPGDGPKTVYVKFGMAGGSWSEPASDAITLDTQPPAITVISPRDGAVIGVPP